MVSNLQAAVLSAWQSIQGSAGQTVTYTQGSTTLTLTAVPAITQTELETIEGLVRTDRVQDFIIKAVDLEGLIPKRGDRIEWDDLLYNVQHPGGGRHYEWMDPGRSLLRIHCKEIDGS